MDLSARTRSAVAYLNSSFIRPDQIVRALLLTLLVIAGSYRGHAHAAVNAFSNLGPEGGMVDHVTYHPTNPSIVYLSSTAGFYRSSNGGDSWELVTDAIWNMIDDIAVHPAVPSRVFAASRAGGILSSNDSGATLQQLSTLPAGMDLNLIHSVEFNSDGTALYVVAGRRVFRSQNLGQSWQEAASIPASTDGALVGLRSDPSNPGTLYAVWGDGGAYASNNFADTWQAWTLPTGITVEDFAVSTSQRVWLATTDGLWFSDMDTGSWTKATGGSGSISSVMLDPLDPDAVYAVAAFAAAKHVTADGSSWTDIPETPLAGLIRKILPHPVEGGRLLLAGDAGVVVTADGGTHWSTSNSGIHATSAYELLAAAGSDRIYMSTLYDGIHFTAGLAQMSPTNHAGLRQLTPANIQNRTLGLYVHSAPESQPSQDTIFVGIPNGIARSHDSGQSWSLLTNVDFQTRSPHKIVAASTNGTTLLAAGRGLFRSIDSGDSWSKVQGLAAQTIGEGFVAAPSNPSVLYLGGASAEGATENQIFKSIDGGMHWAQTATLDSGYVLRLFVDPRTEQTVYACTSLGLLRSNDGGESWTELHWSPMPGDGAVWGFAIDPQNPDILFAGSSARIVRSVDAGATWQALPLPSSPPFWDVRALLVDPRRPHRLIVAASGRGAQEILIQPDLAIEAQAPAAVLAGQSAALSYTIRNRGPFDATDVRTQVTLSSSATNVSIDASDASCTQSLPVITCVHSVLRSGATKNIRVHAVEGSARSVAVGATIGAAQPDVAGQDNSVQVDAVWNAPASQPPSSGNGGGGGGGPMNPLMLILLTGLVILSFGTSRRHQTTCR